MLTFRRLLSCACLLSLAFVSGCVMFSEDAWQRPSPLSGRPPPPVEGKHENQGGFTVLVGGPGQPAAARVVADLGAFAQGRGFVRLSVSPASARYLQGEIMLDVSDQTADLRVVTSLHGPRLNRRFVDQFYQDFRQRYAAGYGDQASMFEDDEGDNGVSSPAGGGERGGGRGGGR